MASFLFGLWALLAVSIIHASSGAAGRVPGQQLVAVLENDLENIAERPELARRHVGEADSADRRLLGIFGISCALATGDAAAASAFVFDDNAYSRRCDSHLAWPLVQGDETANGVHRLHVGIGMGSALVHGEHGAAAGSASQRNSYARHSHGLDRPGAGPFSLDSQSEAADGSRYPGACVHADDPPVCHRSSDLQVCSRSSPLTCCASRDGLWAPAIGSPSYLCQPSSDGEAGSCNPPPYCQPSSDGEAGSYNLPPSCQPSSVGEAGSTRSPSICHVSSDTRAAITGLPTISFAHAWSRVLELAASSKGGGTSACFIRLFACLYSFYFLYTIGHERGETAAHAQLQPVPGRVQPAPEQPAPAQPAREQQVTEQPVREQPWTSQPAVRAELRVQIQSSPQLPRPRQPLTRPSTVPAHYIFDTQQERWVPPRMRPQSGQLACVFTAEQDCAGCRWAAELTAQDQRVHMHCHECQSIRPAESDGACSACRRTAQHEPVDRATRQRKLSAQAESESECRMLRCSDEIRSQADAIRALTHDPSVTPQSVGLDWSLIDENLSLFSNDEREMMGCISQIAYDEPCSKSEEHEHKLSRVMAAGVQHPRGRRVRGSRGGRRGHGRRLRAGQCEQSASAHSSDHRQSQPAHASRVSDDERMLEVIRAGGAPHQWQEWLQIQPAPCSVPDALADQWWRMPPIEDPWERFDRQRLEWDVEAAVRAQLHRAPEQQPEPAQPEPAQPELAQPAYEPFEAEADAFSPGGTARDGYSPYAPESIAERVHARHAPPEPESIGGRVHVRHAAACVMDDTGDEDMPCMF